MDFLLFLLTTTVFLVRPQDFAPELAAVPLYLMLLLTTAVVASPALFDQLSPTALTRRPLTLCVLGVLVAVVLSHLAQGSLWGVRTAGVEFAKVVLFYLVVVGTVTTPQRLQRLLECLVGCTLVITLLAVLQYHEVISLPQLAALEQREIDEESGTINIIPRLRSLGSFNDPNDLCLLLLIGLGLTSYRLTAPRAGWRRLPWLGVLAVLLYALALTQSRGGFLALLVGLVVLLHARFGWWKAGLLAGLVLPLLLGVFAGRQTDLAVDGDTGQDRIQLWSEALMLFRQAPWWGIGQGQFQEEVGLVAHNSYLHCFAELGWLGGTCFLGAFFTAIWTLHRLGQPPLTPSDPELRRLRPYLLALVVAYAMGILALSRAYLPPTYLVLGLAVSYTALAAQRGSALLPRFNLGFVQRLSGVSLAFLLSMYLFVRLAINRG